MRKLLIAGLAVAMSAAAPAIAAQYSFDFQSSSTLFGGPAQGGGGIFTTSDTAEQIGGQTAFAITGISGLINGVAIDGLSSVVGITNYYYFTTGPTFLDGTGVRFDAGAFRDISFFAPSAPSGELYRIRGNGTILANVAATSSAIGSAVPEPSAWAMLTGGFLLIGTALRRRRTTITRLA